MNLKFNPYHCLEQFDQIHVTHREADVIACILNGRTSKKSIADTLNIESRTAETHVRNLMKKFRCSSWEQLRDTFSTSSKVTLYQKHFGYLLLEKDFITLLKKFSIRETIRKHPLLFLIDKHLTDAQLNLIRKIRSSLTQAGYTSFSESIEKEDLISHSRKENYCAAVYFVSDAQSQRTLSNPYQKFITVTLTPSKEIRNINNVLPLDSHNTIFHLILSVLYKATTSKELLAAIDTFSKTDLETIPVINQSSHLYPPKNFRSKHFVIGCIIGIFFLGSLTIYRQIFHENIQIYNVQLPPEKKMLLERKPIINTISQRFYKHSYTDRNPIVILSGIGGSGKTTLARLWTQEQKRHKIIWEINAETANTITASLQSLAIQLATTPTEKTELKEIEDIIDDETRTLRRVVFIKKYFINNQNWIVLFDNVHSYQDILQVLPMNPKIWGKGKILITTRNAHLHHADWVNTENILKISELSTLEQRSLFQKVFDKNSHHHPHSDSINKELKNLLHIVPAFPLDTAVAAKYLAHAQVSINDYVNELNLHKKLLSKKEETLLKETSNYTQTRHAIISLAIDKLVTKNPSYKDLLILIILMDPNHIPLNLLINYSNSTLVEQLIIDLEKSSLCEVFRDYDQLHTLTFHRSLHDHMRSHLLQSTPKAQLNSTIQSAGCIFQSELNTAITEQNHFYVQSLIHHAETFSNFIPDRILKNELLTAIGGAYYEAGQDVKALANLVPILDDLLANNLQKTLLFAQVTSYLGMIAMRRGELEKSYHYLKQSIPIYSRSTRITEYERALVFLGHVQTLLDNFSDANKTFSQAIRLSQLNAKDSAILARALVFQGIVYREIGSYSKAAEITEESLRIYKEGIPKMWALAYLGSVELERGNYAFSKTLLTQSIDYYKKYHSDTHVSLGWILPTLASVYRKLGNYALSISLCQDAIDIFKETNTSLYQNLATAFPTVHAGKANRLNGQLELAKACLENGVATHLRLFGPKNLRTKWAEMAYAQYSIDARHFTEARKLLSSILDYYETCLPRSHPKIGKVLREFSRLHLELGDFEKAEQYIIKALETLKNNYPQHHLEIAHTLLILGKIKTQQGRYDPAEKILRETLHMYENHQHPHLCFAHEALHHLYHSQYLLTCTPHLLKQAKKHLGIAIKIARKVFPLDSTHLQRLNVMRKDLFSKND